MLPNLSSAVMAWQQSYSLDKITKTLVNYQTVETKVAISFVGTVQPLQARQLELKPEGQRQWRWLEIHSTPDLELANDDEVIFKNVRYRVLSVFDYSDYGYRRYEIAEAFTA
jgi:hypothetical protein